MKHKEKKYFIRDLKGSYFFALSLGADVFFTKTKEEAPRYNNRQVFLILSVLRNRGAKVIFEQVNG